MAKNLVDVGIEPTNKIESKKVKPSVGGCNFSKLREDVDNTAASGKEIITTHRGKIGVITDTINSTYGDNKKDETVGADNNEPAKNPTEETKNPSATTTKSTNSRTNSTGKKVGIVMGLKLYSVSDSPPTLAVRMALKYLGLEYEIVNIDFGNGEQVSEDYISKSPQGEVPLLDDNGFLLSESVAILQYLGDKYKVDDTFYPTDAQQRAIVNHRLAFHLSTFYKAIADYMVLPLCYAYPQTEENLNKLKHALKVFNEILTRQSAPYVAGSNLTIADLSMVMGMVCLEAGSIDISDYPKIQEWYEGFKNSHAELWALANQGLEELTEFAKNPPDLSHVNHPVHPTDRSKMAGAEKAPEPEPMEPEAEAEAPADTADDADGATDAAPAEEAPAEEAPAEEVTEEAPPPAE